MWPCQLLVLGILCFFCCASWAQNPEAQTQPAAASSTALLPITAAVPMTDTVLTLQGACQPGPGAAAAPQGCVSSLTRAQFEELITSLTPADRPMPPEKRRTFATQYAKLLTFADAARAMGLENDPRVKQIFSFAKNQILTEALNQEITEQYSHPTDQQIADYYNRNSKKYRELTLQRIVIPRAVNSAGKPVPGEAEEKAYAVKLRERWVAGEAPDKLQKEASQHAASPGPAPATSVGVRRPGSLPEAHESVFDLKAGEVSPVLSDPASFYIYKVVSVRQVPLSEAKASISTALQRQLVADKIQQIQNSVTPVLNDAYFGPANQSSLSQGDQPAPRSQTHPQ